MTLEETRLHRELTQRELEQLTAERGAVIWQSKISDYERGFTTFGLEKRALLEEILGVPIDWSETHKTKPKRRGGSK